LVFGNAKSKLENTRIILDQLKTAKDAINFKAMFNSFLNSSRSITYALQKEGKKINGFKEWYKEKQDEMRKDELLRFMHEARTIDFHEGESVLESAGGYINHFSPSNLGPKPTPDATVGISRDGIYWNINKGTPKERRIPIIKGGSFTFLISIKNPPSQHKGKSLEKNDPITICSLCLKYMEELVFEATEKFR